MYQTTILVQIRECKDFQKTIFFAHKVGQKNNPSDTFWTKIFNIQNKKYSSGFGPMLKGFKQIEWS